MTEALAAKPYSLKVKNALGEQMYSFELRSSKIPEPAGNYDFFKKKHSLYTLKYLFTFRAPNSFTLFFCPFLIFQ